MSEWSKQDRFKALLSGERADRPIGSGWRHFIDKEQTAEDLAETTISFTKNMIGIGSRLIQERLIWRKLGESIRFYGLSDRISETANDGYSNSG